MTTSVVSALKGGAKNMGKSMFNVVNEAVNPYTPKNKMQAARYDAENQAAQIKVGKFVNNMVDRYKQKQINKLKGKKYSPLLGL